MFFNAFIKTKGWVFDLLFPKKCLSCGKEELHVCADCFEKIPINKSFYCYVCGKRSPEGTVCSDCKKNNTHGLTGLLVASDWNNLLVRQIIYELKYRFVRELAEPLGKILANFLETTHLINHQADQLIFIPVPLHKRRLGWRGFNQTDLLTNEVGKRFAIATTDNLLARSRHTPPQKDISDKKERIKNVANAFLINNNFANKEQIKNKIVILIDDVCTTGSTLNECALALRPLKPKEIWGLVVARG